MLSAGRFFRQSVAGGKPPPYKEKGVNVMAKISFEGIGEVMATFTAKSGLESGMACKMTGSGEVGACAAGERFCGLADYVDDGLAAVQVGGFTPMAYSGTVAAGWVKLVADGNGGVKTDAANGVEYLVVEVDSREKVATILL